MLPPPPTDPYVTNSVIRFVSNGPNGTINLAVDETTRRHGFCCPSKLVTLRSDLCACRASCVWTGCGLNVPPAFPWHRRHARHCLPALLRVLSWVPWASVPHASGQESPPPPAVPCAATTAFVRPGRCALCSLPVPWFDALLFVSRPAFAGLGSSVGRIDHQTPGCWLCRPPTIRLLLPRRREALPSSRVTLVPTCPALRPRWCPARLP